MTTGKTKRIYIKPKKDLDIFDDDFEVIYEGDLPEIKIEEDDYRDVLRGLSDIDDTDYIRKNDYDQYVTEMLQRSNQKQDAGNNRRQHLSLHKLTKSLENIIHRFVK